MPKPKTRSRYIRRMHKLAERLQRAKEMELRELEEFLHEATIQELQATLIQPPPEDSGREERRS